MESQSRDLSVEETDATRVPATIVIAAPSSGSGKTTVTCGLIAALTRRNLQVRPFKCGPDFLDGMQHEAAARAGQVDMNDEKSSAENIILHPRRRTINLDGWLMGSKEAVQESFYRHSVGADICIIEGVMGLHDAKDGKTDEGSTAQIAKILGAPVILVVDASKSARSVAATALGQALMDPEVRLCGVIANKVAGKAHTHWIEEAVTEQGSENAIHRLIDVGTGLAAKFIGGLPRDSSAAVPERHLGLSMPNEETEEDLARRFERLAAMIEENLDVDAILELGKSYQPLGSKLDVLKSCKHGFLGPSPLHPCEPSRKCRIGLADDAAFSFYYGDNLQLLQMAGAELVPFSPLTSKKLPPNLDGIYFGGGYPELHADILEQNISMRQDIKSFAEAGGAIYAECGGMMYLAECLFLSQEDPRPRAMCGVLPGVTVRMTKQCTMYYAEVAFTPENPIFFSEEKNTTKKDEGARSPTSSIFKSTVQCRGQEFHYSKAEVVTRLQKEKDNANGQLKMNPVFLTKQHPGATPETGGFAIFNTFASYLHLHFASAVDTNRSRSPKATSLADSFVESALKNSPRSKAFAVSFVSAATEIIFALKAESKLSGVTSLCDYPSHARLAPRQVVCRSKIDAASMTSEEVAAAVEELKLARETSQPGGPPGNWIVSAESLHKLKPRVAFVQSTCDICDPAKDDVLHALDQAGLIRSGPQAGTRCNVVSVAPTTLEGLFVAIEDISAALGCQERGLELRKSLRRRLERVTADLAKVSERRRIRVLSLEGLAPLCTGGHWLPDIKVAAGCEDALGDQGGCPARIITWDIVLNADPDVLLLSPCSANPARTMEELHLVASAPEFWKLKCVQRGEVYVLDHARFSRPSPRLIDGIEMLATLLHGIPPSAGKDPNETWGTEAYKYECWNDHKGCGVSHCSTELATRFKPCFSESSHHPQQNIEKRYEISLQNAKSVLSTQEDQGSAGLRRCRVTPCTIKGNFLPKSRSAHCMVSYHRNNAEAASILLVGGEAADSSRLSDVWVLHAPQQGWMAAYHSSIEDDASKTPILGVQPTWEFLKCAAIYGEDVPTPRSNHACVVCGEYLLVFGGWASDNVTPVSHCELLHLETHCWTHCSTRDNYEPPPRGNPTLVYIDYLSSAFMFGGWNRSKRLNDLWLLDMQSWSWKEIKAEENDALMASASPWPNQRTDHSAVVWKRAPNDDSVMLIFGGTIEDIGASSELWALELQLSLRGRWSWRKLEFQGSTPPPRTSHASAIVGQGKAAKMVVCGGTDCYAGSGKAGLLNDAWILDLGNMVWTKLEWGIERCRHSLVSLDSSLILWGGFDGEETIVEDKAVCVATIEDGKMNSIHQNKISAERKRNSRRNLQERWDAERPVTLEDLPSEELEKAKRSRLPGAIQKALHRYAVANNRDTYIDPSSGYSVFSQVYLKRRQCCGNGCRHCPHGQINVPKRNGNTEHMKSLDW